MSKIGRRREKLSAAARAALTFALGAGAAGEAAAQQASEEIVVTATRRDQALQDVPVAITAVSSEAIQNSGIRDIHDLTSVVPSLQFNVGETSAAATARLRGVGTQGSNPGLESAVGVIVDGVFRARNGVALGDLGDVQQIEVLRGPQGTLFGKNTSAGLISVTTRAPDLNEFSATAEATAGNFGERRLQAGVNIPLLEGQLGLRLFGADEQRDGIMEVNPDGENTLLGAPGLANQDAHQSNDRDMYTLRAQLLWDIDPDTDLRFIGDYTKRAEFCCTAQIYDPELLNGNPVQILDAAGVPGAPLAYGTGRQQWVANLGGYGPNVSADTPLGAQGAGELGARTAFANRRYDSNLEEWGVSAEFNHDFGAMTVTSITAFRDWNSEGGADADYSQADLLYAPRGSGNRYGEFSQEVRLGGESGQLNWLVGGFFSSQKIERNFGFAIGEQYGAYFQGLDNLISLGSVSPGLGVTPAGGLLGSLYDGIATIPAGSGQSDQYEQQGQSYALFTHNILSLTPATQLSFGVRWTHERKELDATFDTALDASALLANAAAGLPSFLFVPGETGAGFGNCDPSIQPSGNGVAALDQRAVALMRSGYCLPWLRGALDAVGYDQEREESEWSGVISLRQAFTPNMGAYASYSRGYKGGGFNLDRNFSFLTAGGAPDTSFAPETVDAYEIGLKSSWFENALVINLAAYHNAFEDFQLNTFNGIQFVVSTIPEVHVEGVELDATWRTPIDGLSAQGGAAYNDAAYGDDTGWVAANRNPITGEATLGRLPDNQLSNSPLLTVTTALSYERSLFGGAINFLGYVDARYASEQNTGSDLRLSKTQPAYTLVNARLGVSSPDERWAFEVWGRNVFDQEYAQIMFDAPLQLGLVGPTQAAFLGEPRTIGATLRLRY